ncbi:hypothetical protein [Aeromonas veronii]|uniref:hypothetical protein n=1 Tax=Aeromonas veronii TaxID=654 RepID=UPI0039F6875F
MSVPGWPGRRAGLATGVSLADGPGWPPVTWYWSLPVGRVGVGAGHLPDVGT